MWRKLECKCIKKISTGIWNEAEKPDALSLSLCKARRKCPKRQQMAPVVWRPVCLFRLLCNKMDTLRLTKYAFQPFNFLFFLFPVFRQQVLVPLIVKKKICFGSQGLGRRWEAPSLAAHLKSRLWWWVMHYRPFHHGPWCSHKASYLSQVFLLMGRKAQEQNFTGCCAPLCSWADVGLCGAVLQELSCSLLSSFLHFPSSSTHVRFLSRTGQG